MMKENQHQLNEQTIRRIVQLEGLKQAETEKFVVTLKEIDTYLRLQLTKEELAELSRADLKHYFNMMNSDLYAILTQWANSTAETSVEIGVEAAKFEAKSINRAVGQDVAKIPAVGTVTASILNIPLAVQGMRGQTVNSTLKAFTEQEAKRIVGEVILGVSQSKTNAEIIRILRGTRAKRYQDGILNISARNAEAITRTIISHTHNTARFEVSKQNSDIIKHIRIVATLDGKTSAICRSLDGQEFPLKLEYCPPFHINCRSFYNDVLKDEYAGKDIKSKRASKDGYAEDMPYYDWLKTQSPAFQDEVLGKFRGKLFRDGGLTTERFRVLQLDRKFKPLTLDEMRKLEPLAFERAGVL